MGELFDSYDFATKNSRTVDEFLKETKKVILISKLYNQTFYFSAYKGAFLLAFFAVGDFLTLGVVENLSGGSEFL